MITSVLYHRNEELKHSALAKIWEEAKSEVVESIDLSQNQFTKLDLPAFALPSVKALDISRNQAPLANLRISATVFPNLEYLFLYESQVQNIQFEGVFEHLKEANLAKNEIKRLEGWENLLNSPQLSHLFLYGNPIQNLPRELFDEDRKNAFEALKAFLEESQKGTIINDRAKLIIVGNGRVGKTSLFKVLRKGGKYDPHEKFTHGINLGELSKNDLSKIKTDSLRLKVWDFGGQQIFYALHQFFLSENAVYILAWTNPENVKNYPQEKDQPVDEKWRSNEYWLENIKHLGKKSPVLMVQTHYNNQNNRIKDTHYPDYEVSEYINFDASNQYNLDTLKTHLVEVISEKIERFGSEEPITYENVVNHIETLKKSKQTEITYQKFLELCAIKDEKGRSIDKGNEKELLNLLKIRGIVLHYEETDFPSLKDIIFISPEAITEQVYALIHNNLASRQGKFDEQYVKDFLLNKGENAKNKSWLKSFKQWIFPDYNDATKRKQFIDLLLKFKLVFETQEEGKRVFIAPQYLPNELKGDKKTLFQDTLEESKLSFVFAFPKYIPDNVLVNFWSEYGPYSSESIYKNGIYFKKEGRKFVVLYKEKNEKGEIVNQLFVHSKNELTDYKLLKEICQAFAKLSRNAYAEISLDNIQFVDYQALCECVGKTSSIQTTSKDWIPVNDFHFLLGYFERGEDGKETENQANIEKTMKNQAFKKRFQEAIESQIPELLDILQNHYSQIPSHFLGSYNKLKNEFSNRSNNFNLSSWQSQFLVLISSFDFEIVFENSNAGSQQTSQGQTVINQYAEKIYNIKEIGTANINDASSNKETNRLIEEGFAKIYGHLGEIKNQISEENKEVVKAILAKLPEEKINYITDLQRFVEQAQQNDRDLAEIILDETDSLLASLQKDNVEFKTLLNQLKTDKLQTKGKFEVGFPMNWLYIFKFEVEYGFNDALKSFWKKANYWFPDNLKRKRLE
jgi:GTPase SAR1 family protein